MTRKCTRGSLAHRPRRFVARFMSGRYCGVYQIGDV